MKSIMNRKGCSPRQVRLRFGSRGTSSEALSLTLVTAPLFLFLGYCIAISASGAVVQGLALLRASYAVFGFVGAFIGISFGWVPAILPPILYYSLMKNLPGLWLRPDASRRTKVFSSLAVIVLLPLATYLIYHGVVWGIVFDLPTGMCIVLLTSR